MLFYITDTNSDYLQVDHSELPYRLLSKEYGCQAAYTPMFHASNFATQKKYRQKFFSTCPEDRPLIVQFCANDPDCLIAAANIIKDQCDAIDLNLGCPQEIARRGRYGAFLQDEWNLISEICTRLRSNLDNNIGFSCKIRIFEDEKKSIDYARLFEKAGCSFLGVHGRLREQRGVKCGIANWNHIKIIKESINIPVIANGNIQSKKDADDCLKFTKADAVMTAEGILYNPAILKNIHPPAWEVAKRYLEFVDKYPVASGMAKSHIFKLFHRCIAMDDNKDLRTKLGNSLTLEQLKEVVNDFESKYKIEGENQTVDIRLQPVPPYLCQPRFRYSDSEDLKKNTITDVVNGSINKRLKTEITQLIYNQ